MKPAATMQGMAIRPTRPNLHSKMKARIMPTMMEEKFMTRVDTIDVAKLFTCRESTPNLLAAAPPRLRFFSNHLTGSLSNLW